LSQEVDTVQRAAATPDHPQPFRELGLKDDEYERIREILADDRLNDESTMWMGIGWVGPGGYPAMAAREEVSVASSGSARARACSRWIERNELSSGLRRSAASRVLVISSEIDTSKSNGNLVFAIYVAAMRDMDNFHDFLARIDFENDAIVSDADSERVFRTLQF